MFVWCEWGVFKVVRLGVCVLFLFCAAVGRAQASVPLALSIDECISMALASHSEVRNAKLDEKIQFQQIQLYLSRVFPAVKYDFSPTYFFRIPKIFVSDFITPLFKNLAQTSVPNSAEQSAVLQVLSNIRVPGVDKAEGGFFATFGTPWAVVQDISIQQVVYEPSLIITLHTSRKLREFARRNTQVIEDKVRVTVAKMYVNLWILQKRKALADSLYGRTLEMQTETDRLVATGLREEIDRSRIALEVAKIQILQAQMQQATANVQAAMLQILGEDRGQTLQLTTPVTQTDEPTSLVSEPLSDYAARSDMRLLQTVQELRSIDIKRRQLDYLPTLYAFGNIGYRDLGHSFSFFGKRAFANHFVGVRLHIDLFGGMSKRRNLEIARLEYKKQKNLYDNTRELIGVELETKRKNYLSALNTWHLWESNKNLSATLYEQTKVRYGLGKASSFELLQVANQYDEIVDKTYQALLDVAVARIELRAALGQTDQLLAE